MRKLLTILLVLPSLVLASGGPKYGFDDPKLDDEINNIYQELSHLKGTIRSSGVLGTPTNDNAIAGRIGQVISSSSDGATISPSNTGIDVTSIPLTPGDWMVFGYAVFRSNGATWTNDDLMIATLSGDTFAEATGDNGYITEAWASSALTPLDRGVFGSRRMLIAVNTTVYLKLRVIYSAGGPPSSRWNRIMAVRIR